MENQGAYVHGGVRPRAGRKPVHIDLMQLEKLAALQCTDEELAAWFGVSPYTIAKRRKKPEFAEAIERGRVPGAHLRAPRPDAHTAVRQRLHGRLARQAIARAKGRRHQRAHRRGGPTHPVRRETRSVPAFR